MHNQRKDYMKNNKTIEPKAPKQPKTIKIKTLVLVVAWVISLLGSLYAGWTMKQADTERVNSEARVMLNSLIETAQNTKVSK